MKIGVEIFFVKIVAGDVLYTKYICDISEFQNDPDKIVSICYQNFLGRFAPSIGERCFMHSTGWRYNASTDTQYDVYLAYSEDFDSEEWSAKHRVPFGDLAALLPWLSEPKVASSEVGILAHALRHLAFLVQTDTSGKFKEMLDPQNFRRLSALPAGLAGRIG